MNGEGTCAVVSGNDFSPVGIREMPDYVYGRLSDLIYSECGIKLGENRKTMLASRLNKRLHALKMESYSEYFEYIRSAEGGRDEFVRMIDAVSTNKTEFFRESAQFDFLLQKALPALTGSAESTADACITLWSAGCSSGEEPYTLAFICAEFFSRREGSFNIVATDISTRVLDAARSAIYPDSAVGSIPNNLKRKYLMKGKGAKAGYHRVVPELVRRIRFSRHNLIRDDFNILPMMNIIFCRNVVIYFDRETQIALYRRFFDRLLPGGFLFIGHSETLYRLEENLLRIAPTIYRKRE